MDSNPLESTKSALFKTCFKLKKLIGNKNLRLIGFRKEIETTYFFHLAARIRGSKNQIDKVEFKGNSLESHPQIKATVVEFFSDIDKPSLV